SPNRAASPHPRGLLGGPPPTGNPTRAAGTPAVPPITPATNPARPAIRVAPHHGENFTAVMAPDGRTVYVGGSFGPSFNKEFVVPISTATGAVGKAIVLRGHPYVMALTPDGKTLYVVCAGFPGPQEVVPVHTATNTAGKAINTGMQPGAIAISGSRSSPFEQAVQDGLVGARHVH